jgi:G protein-coupled receptor kinase
MNHYEFLALKKEFIIDNQPIGKRLFRRFCATNDTYNNFYEFIESIEKFELAEDNLVVRNNLESQIIEKFLNKNTNSASYIGSQFQDSDLAELENFLAARKAASIRYILLNKFYPRINRILYDKPFKAFFNDSIFFKRYLQFKNLEKIPVTKNSFRMYRVLGKGGFGEVCACQSRSTGRMYACKKLEKKRIKKRKGEMMAINEKQILEKVSSRFIVNLAYAFESKDSLCLILTLMNGGDLKFHIYHLAGEFTEDRALFYTAEIICGLSHLHANRIVYRDLKPENILLDDSGHIRISDLGLAVEIPVGEKIKVRVGTVGYMAPEVIKGEYYTFSPDLWGLGCLIYEMIEGQSPFRHRKEKVKRDEIDKRVREQRETYSSKFSPFVRDLCSSVSLSASLNDQHLTTNIKVKFVFKLLEKDPSKRLGCGDENGTIDNIKNHPCFVFNWKRIEAAVDKPPFIPDVNLNSNFKILI